MYSKWMPIFRTTPKTYYAFTMPVPIKEPMDSSGIQMEDDDVAELAKEIIEKASGKRKDIE